MINLISKFAVWIFRLTNIQKIGHKKKPTGYNTASVKRHALDVDVVLSLTVPGIKAPIGSLKKSIQYDVQATTCALLATYMSL
jgi:hypothetical protein